MNIFTAYRSDVNFVKDQGANIVCMYPNSSLCNGMVKLAQIRYAAYVFMQSRRAKFRITSVESVCYYRSEASDASRAAILVIRPVWLPSGSVAFTVSSIEVVPVWE